MSKTKIEQPQSVSGAFDALLNKMYISNVQNRLRQLNEPTDNDCRRWVWELIQNAKDSISNDENRNSVDIKLGIRDKEVKFSHNGSPFTAEAQLGLLYKYSEGKVNNSESTGRFGTGFLTTHALSKIVSIEGDVLTNVPNDPLCGFSATMYRDGIDEPELLEGVTKMKDGMVYTKEINNWTTYTYHLKTPQNENALRLGLDNFMSNIAQTMLFCKELKSVELDNNGIITKIARNESILLENEIYFSDFEINGETCYKRRFIHRSIKKHSEDLSKRFKTERNIRLTAAIEIDSTNSIIENLDSPSHFCVLPLVGSEKHTMPIYLNSPDFEPDSERESLILIGEDILADKGVISEGGINRLILKESNSLYDSIVSYLSQSKYNNLYLLAKGLNTAPQFEKNFNKEWFEEEIIKKYREALTNYAVVETQCGNQKLFTDNDEPNIIIPKDIKFENQNKIYELSTELFAQKLPLNNIAKEWAELAWKECGLFRIKDLCNFVAEKKSVTNLPVSSNQYNWLNSFLGFIKETDESLLKEFALIPNHNNEFISLENEYFTEGVGLTEYMIKVLYELGEDLTPILLNENVSAINLILKTDASIVAAKINEQSEKITKDNNLPIESKVEKLLTLLNTIPTDEAKYTVEFINKQKQIHGFTRELFPNLQFDETLDNDIPEKAWEISHKWLVAQLIETVAKCENVNGLPETIQTKYEWLNSFIAFVSNEIKEGELDKHAIIPNQKGNFCLKKDLSKDLNIPEELKSEKAEKYGIKLKDVLLHKEIDSITITREKNINTVIEIINEILKNNRFEEGHDALNFAIYLVHFLPEETSNLLYNSQKALLDIVRNYYFNRSGSYFQITIPCNVEDFWSKANNTLIKSLQDDIEKNASIEHLKTYLTESDKEYDNGDTIIFLNSYYDYLSKLGRTVAGKIIPNQNGLFCSLDDEFYKDVNIPNPLKDILFLISPETDFRTILADTSLPIQPHHAKNIADIAKIIDDCIKETYSNPRNWDNESFKEAIKSLMIDWFPKYRAKEIKDIFPYSYERKETIEMNVLWSLEERQRMQRARSIAPDLLDRFIETSDGINALNKEKETLEAKLFELKSQIENSILNNIVQDITKEFPNITVERIRELLKLEEQMNVLTSPESVTQPQASSIGLYPVGSEEDIKISPALTDNSSEKSRISVSEDAKEIIFQSLKDKGFDVSESIKINYTIVDGVISPTGKSIKIVVKSAKAGKIYFNPSEWLALTEPDSQLFVVTRGNVVRNITLSDIESLNDIFHMRFNTHAFAMTNLTVFANFFRYLPYTHFIFESPESTTDYLQQFGLSERNPSSRELSADDKNLLH